MTDDQDLVGLYVLDALDDVERARLERRLRDDPQLQDEVDRVRAVTAALAQVTPAVDPPPSLRPALMRQIAETSQDLPDDRTPGSHQPRTRHPDGRPQQSDVPSAPDVDRRRRLRVVLAGAAAAAAVATAGVAVTQPWADDQKPAPVTAQRVMDATDASTHSAGAGDGPITVVTSAQQDRAVLSAQQMPPAPAGTVHQVWFLDAGQRARSAGIMQGSGPWLLEGPAAGAAAVAVTVEPAGGSRQPTSTPLATVKLT